MENKDVIINLVNELTQIFDPEPELISDEFPLRWEAEINIEDYDFNENHLELDEDYECENGEFLQSVSSAIEIDLTSDDKFSFTDGVFYVESHSWCSKLNSNDDYPSLSLLKAELNSLAELKGFIMENYG